MKKVKQRCVTFIIDSSLDDAIEKKAKRNKTFKSVIIADAIRAYIEKKDDTVAKSV